MIFLLPSGIVRYRCRVKLCPVWFKKQPGAREPRCAAPTWSLLPGGIPPLPGEISVGREGLPDAGDNLFARIRPQTPLSREPTDREKRACCCAGTNDGDCPGAGNGPVKLNMEMVEAQRGRLYYSYLCMIILPECCAAGASRRFGAGRCAAEPVRGRRTGLPRKKRDGGNFASPEMSISTTSRSSVIYPGFETEIRCFPSGTLFVAYGVEMPVWNPSTDIAAPAGVISRRGRRAHPADRRAP